MVDHDEGQEQEEEDELDDDPIVPFDDDNEANSSQPPSSNTVNKSTLPATSPSAAAVTTPMSTDTSLERELEELLTPEAGEAPRERVSKAADQQPEPPMLNEAGRDGGKFEEVSLAIHKHMFRPNRFVVSKSSATSSQRATPRMTHA